jgi:SAM-dependent methyltransferase
MPVPPPAVPVRTAYETAATDEKTREETRVYYGETLKKTEDLKTNACCTGAAPPKHIKNAIAKIHPEVNGRYYGCGLVVPDELDGLSTLDLGCGAGRDVYLLAQLVGEKGRVVGIDMTKEQLAVAREHIQWHADKFGFAAPNTEFVEGIIENLGACGLADESFDLIVSNPPVHLGLQTDFRVLRTLIAGAAKRLRHGGALWLVAQTYVPVGRLLARQAGRLCGARAAYDDGRFTVWTATKAARCPPRTDAQLEPAASAATARKGRKLEGDSMDEGDCANCLSNKRSKKR